MSFVDLKGVIDVDALWSTKDVDKVVKHFNDNHVDSIVLSRIIVALRTIPVFYA